MFPSLSSPSTAAQCIVSLLYMLSATASAIPVTSETSNVELETRAPVGHSCAGNNNGVYGCATVTFKDRYNLDIDLSVKDTKGDSHPVYAWVRVYDDRGNTDLTKLPNHSGVGRTVSTKQTWRNTRGRITGFRTKACVSDAGPDTCFDGPFVSNPLP